ncbi:hypothetical protein [Rubrimonas cliftonensis]|uniref:Uncharacterized protein n=1 Tax=Rubrimonas cliftonensis TaxID=89524 RepID=A0A1H4G4V9_9RHOB|nr:hypothetical protein [Rubrimonas cliftonensis]SEB04663.1 hypothetical protein SAMN05444370_1382 [Rubrimonas cliftonensis]
MALRFTASQVSVIGAAMTPYRADDIRLALLRDFPEALSDRSPADLGARVRSEVARFLELGFRRHEHVHMLVAWSLLTEAPTPDAQTEAALREALANGEPEDWRFALARRAVMRAADR